jgi:hypothetical protein
MRTRQARSPPCSAICGFCNATLVRRSRWSTYHE